MEKELQLIMNNLDFTGSKASWFDNWSTGFDWEGEGNISPEKRIYYLKLMLKFFNEAKTRLKEYPKEYQIWMEFSEEDSSLDGVYIHTSNPNKSPFPQVFEIKKGMKIKNETIAQFVTKNRLTAGYITKGSGKVIVAYEPATGIPPVR